MEKQSKVSQVHEITKHDGIHGTTYYHHVTMENGDIGSVGRKKDNSVQVGDQLNYEFIPSGSGNKIKLVQNNASDTTHSSSDKGYRSRDIPTSDLALAYAKDLGCANIRAGRELSSMEIIKVADVFRTWLNTNR